MQPAPLQVSHICVQCTFPVCSTELIPVLQHSTSSPGEQEHRGDGLAWGCPPGTPLDLRTVGSGAQCQLRQGRRAMFSVHFSFPVSTSRTWSFPCLSLHLRPHDTPTWGGSHPPTAPSPWSALLLPTPALLSTAGIEVSSHPYIL